MMEQFQGGGSVEGEDDMSSLSRLLGGLDANEDMDPSVKMILQSIRKNEQQQLRHVMKYLDTTL